MWCGMRILVVDAADPMAPAILRRLASFGRYAVAMVAASKSQTDATTYPAVYVFWIVVIDHTWSWRYGDSLHQTAT